MPTADLPHDIPALRLPEKLMILIREITRYFEHIPGNGIAIRLRKAFSIVVKHSNSRAELLRTNQLKAVYHEEHGIRA